MRYRGERKQVGPHLGLIAEDETREVEHEKTLETEYQNMTGNNEQD